VKKQQWILGLVISLCISLIAASPRLIRMDSPDFSFIIVALSYNLFFCLSCWVIYQFLFNNITRWQVKGYRIFITAIVIFSVACLTYTYDYFFSQFTERPLQFPEITGDKRPYILLLRGLLVSGLFYFISYYLYAMAEKQKSNLEIATLKQAQLAANLSSLKDQLSPHFLFNTLNTLSSLTEEKVVKDYVSALANVYRYVLQYKEMDTATVKEELEFIASYLYIIKTRLETAIAVDIDVKETALASRIPPLTLQLLIENAVKHNIASATRQLVIEITSSDDGFLVIRNNFQPKLSMQVSGGIGLSNVLQRYRLLFNRNIEIEKTDVSFTVKLPLV